MRRRFRTSREHWGLLALETCGERRTQIKSLGEFKQSAPRAPYDWMAQVEIQEVAARSWVALAKGNREEARALARAAADLEDRTEKHPVTPGFGAGRRASCWETC